MDNHPTNARIEALERRIDFLEKQLCDETRRVSTRMKRINSDAIDGTQWLMKAVALIFYLSVVLAAVISHR